MNTTQAVNAGSSEFSIRKIIGPMMAIILGMIMVILDSTVVNVALPGLVKDFKSDVATLSWTITGYTLALSAVIPLAGWMTDRFGGKRVFMITVAFFTLGSVLCSIAQTPEQLIIYRIIQGLGGGMVAPIGMAMVFRLAPPEKMGSVMGLLGVPMLLAPALGPVLAGYFIEYVSWHWIFLINLPIGIIALLVAMKFLPKTEKKAVPSLDIKGMILAPIAFATLAYAVSEGGTSWTSTNTITALIVGGIALIAFIFVELRQKQPLLELRVFASKDFSRGIVIAWLSQIALFGSFMLVPLYLQGVKNYNAFDTGLILLPQALASGIFMPLGGRLFDKIGARPLAITGLTAVTLALIMLSQITIDTSLPYIMGALILMGGGMGCSMMPLNTHILQAAPRSLVHRVTPLTTAAQQVMVSFAVAGLSGFLVSRISTYMTEKGNPLDASISAYGDTFIFAACVAASGAVLALLLRKPKPQASETKTDDKGNAAMMMNH
ncbi:MFS transporter [Paenibacillus swuensis]|uniref:MFS transporter n=1 Tax=Paenibacillus swuensis TaxID=1178515 RepID=A0A172TH36_9BACL|nr:MDR family MFS transporter [Paenibacillus swuensis]ANE46177.1 MFS transporter [Paenibacillus swuensis]